MFLPVKESPNGDGTTAYVCLKRRYKNDRSRFLVVSGNITRGNRHIWQVGRLRLVIRKAFLTRSSREVVAVPTLESFHSLAG